MGTIALHALDNILSITQYDIFDVSFMKWDFTVSYSLRVITLESTVIRNACKYVIMVNV